MRRGILFYIALAVAAALTMGACSDDDSELDELLTQEDDTTNDSTDDDEDDENDDEDEDDDEDSITPLDIEFDYSALDEDEEEFSSDDNDYVENSSFDNTVYLTYNGDEVTYTGATDEIDLYESGAHVTIKSEVSGMHYVLDGSTDDGSFKIYSEKKFKLTLNGVTITNPTGAAINNQCGKSFYIVLADGTTSTITDGSSYTSTVSGEDMKGAIFSEGQIIFSGSGTLDVQGNCKGGIVSDDYIIFRPGNVINVTTTVGNGVKSNDGIYVRGGVLNISVAGEGSKGINSEYVVDISGGRTTIITTGATEVDDTETTSSGGVKADTTMTMTGGILNIKNTGEGGKGINCDYDIRLGGGELNVVTLGEKTYASPKGVKADGVIYITAGSVYSYSAYSDPIDGSGGLEIASGYTTLESGDRLFQIVY